jgi:hypothetical protein
VRTKRLNKKLPALVWAGAGAAGLLVAAAGGCSSTEFHYEGPGQPGDRASGSVPTGMIGVCRRPFSEKPPIVNAVLWEHAKICNAQTPPSFIRLGYGHERGDKVEAKKKVDKMMEALKEGPRQDVGNTRVLSMLRTIRSEGEADPWLRDRISKQSARTEACDYTYLFNTMESESAKLKGDRCAARAYDQVARDEVCLFDTQVEEAVWLTSTWACVTRTGEIGNTESCHRLCAYDDYCSEQVSCATPDVDLALCALGVCLPEPNGIVF